MMLFIGAIDFFLGKSLSQTAFYALPHSSRKEFLNQ